MATTLTLQFATAGGNTFGAVHQLSDADTARLVNAYKAIATTDVNPTPTNTDAAAAWVRQIVAMMRQTIREIEQQQAAASIGSDITVV